MTGPPAEPWHAIDAAGVVADLATDAASGISDAAAAARLEQYGPNRLEAIARTRWYTVFARQFVDVLIAILAAAAVISLAVGEVADAVAIAVILVLNGVLGFIQEWRAEQAIDALQRMLTPSTTVIRAGSQQTVAADLVVPGDVVLLEVGARVPADVRITDASSLNLDEAVLTGESLPVEKTPDAVADSVPLAERSSMAWMGTTITGGRGRGVVVATGMRTEFGRIAELTQSVDRDPTPLQRRLAVLGKWLGIAAIAVSVLVVLAGLLVGNDLLEMFLTGVSLAVAVVPEGLPAVVTITLALGVRTMVRKKALLRRLPAAETLGAATVVCTDKTGTLTQNEMTVRRIWLPAEELHVTGTGYDPAGEYVSADGPTPPSDPIGLQALLATGLRCNHAQVFPESGGWVKIGEPTEAALVAAALKAGLSRGADEFRTVAEFFFDSTRKRMTMVYAEDDGLVAHAKGAPEIILDRCSMVLHNGTPAPFTEEAQEAARAAYHRFAADGLRTLALARRTLPSDAVLDADAVERDLTLLGIVGILDPPRPEVAGAIAQAHSAGIDIVMVTGDAADTALAIAHRIGLRADRAVTGPDLDAMDDAALLDALDADTVFARVSPEHKLRIVSLLQDRGEVVGMTGDGVNDAPALKKADIGIAMGIRGTDVARSASDMVLTDDNFASIINAVAEGRRQYDNIQKFVRYLLSSNIAEIVAILTAILSGAPLVLLPAQILWINLVTDGVTAVALGVEPAEAGIMDRPPRLPSAALLDRGGMIRLALIGGYMGLATYGMFTWYYDGPDTATARTLAFAGLVVFELINLFNFRSLRAPMRRVGVFSNPWLLYALGFTILVQLAAIYLPILQRMLQTVPLSLKDWGVIVLVGLPVFIANEFVKVRRWRTPLT